MVKVEIKAGTLRDICYVAANLREQDKREIFATARLDSGTQAGAASYLSSPDWCWTAWLDGQPVAAFGVSIGNYIYATLMEDQLSVAGGIATLDSTGNVPESQLGNIPKASDYGSVAEVEAATIGGAVQYLRTAGYYSPGDGGGALYKRVATQPSHAGKVQSADGAWWELAENRPSIKMFGAKGDGTTDDAWALGNAINYCYAHLLSPELYIPSGYYKIAQAIPDFSKSITITGDGPRVSVLMLHGSNSTLNIRGTSARATDVTFDNFSANASNMSAGGLSVRVDFAQSTLFSDFMVYDPYDGIHIRQAGETMFRDSGIDGTIRGEFGIYAYGENVTRNGQNDQIDIIVFSNAVLQANYQKGGAIPTAELVVLDGRIHTVQINGLRLLNALRGLRTKNTPGLAKNLVPRFITGDALEVENTYAENILIEYGTDIWIDNVFSAGSFNADGINIKSTAGNVRFEKGSINSNKLHGLNNEGCSSLILSNVDVFNNSLGTEIQRAVFIWLAPDML